MSGSVRIGGILIAGMVSGLVEKVIGSFCMADKVDCLVGRWECRRICPVLLLVCSEEAQLTSMVGMNSGWIDRRGGRVG